MPQYWSVLWIAFQTSILALGVRTEDPDPALKETAAQLGKETRKRMEISWDPPWRSNCTEFPWPPKALWAPPPPTTPFGGQGKFAGSCQKRYLGQAHELSLRKELARRIWEEPRGRRCSKAICRTYLGKVKEGRGPRECDCCSDSFVLLMLSPWDKQRGNFEFLISYRPVQHVLFYCLLGICQFPIPSCLWRLKRSAREERYPHPFA